MAIVDGTIEWLKDESTGVPVGFKKKDGTEGALVTASTNLTGRIGFSAGGEKTELIQRRTETLRVALFGDSTAIPGPLSNPATQDGSFITSPFSATLDQTTLIEFNFAARYGLSRFYPMARVVASCGISGQTIDQMLARDGLAYSTTRKAATDALNLMPDVIILRAGINNLASTGTPATPATWSAVADATFEKAKTLIARLSSSGVPVLVNGCFGYGPGSSATAPYPDSVRLAVLRYNTLLKDYCDSVDGLYYIDPIGVTMSSDGLWMTGLSSDGVHQNFNASQRISQVEANALDVIFGISNQSTYTGSNIVTNALMSSESAGLATGYTISKTGCTQSNTRVSVIDGKVWQSAEFALTNASNLVFFTIPFPVVAAGFSVGDTVGVSMDYYIKPLNGSSLSTDRLDFAAKYAKTGQGIVKCMYQPAAIPFPIPADGLQDKAFIPPFKLTEASASLEQSRCSLDLFIEFIEGAGSVEIGISSPVVVKLP